MIISLPHINYFYGGKLCGGPGITGGKARKPQELAFTRREILSSSPKHKPKQARAQISKVNVRQLAVRSFRHGIKVAGQREYQRGARPPRNDLRSLTEDAAVAQIAWQRDAHKCVSNHETVSCQRTHPTVNVEAAGSPRSQHRHRQQGG